MMRARKGTKLMLVDLRTEMSSSGAVFLSYHNAAPCFNLVANTNFVNTTTQHPTSPFDSIYCSSPDAAGPLHVAISSQLRVPLSSTELEKDPYSTASEFKTQTR